MRSDLGIIVLVFLCAYVAYIFFDKSTPINAPVKTATMMAFLFFSLFFLYETRLSLGREKWHLYVAFAFISSIISAYASIPALIVYIIKGDVIGISIYETVLVFAFFIFSTFKLFLVGELVPERGSNVVNKLIASATERIHELKPAEPAEEKIEELDENQFSILGTDAENEESQGSAEEAESDTEKVLADNGENTVDEGILTLSDDENAAKSSERIAENGTSAENADETSPEGAVCDTAAIPEDKGNTPPIDTADEEINTRVEFSDEKDIKEE